MICSYETQVLSVWLLSVEYRILFDTMKIEMELGTYNILSQ